MVQPRHLLLIGAGPGVGAGVVRRFGREGFRSTLISRAGTDFDPDAIAELFRTAHNDSEDSWQTDYRFTGVSQ